MRSPCTLARERAAVAAELRRTRRTRIIAEACLAVALLLSIGALIRCPTPPPQNHGFVLKRVPDGTR